MVAQFSVPVCGIAHLSTTMMLVKLGKASENLAVVECISCSWLEYSYEILDIRPCLYSESGARALMHQEATYSICDHICKKRSSTHRFNTHISLPY